MSLESKVSNKSAKRSSKAKKTNEKFDPLQKQLESFTQTIASSAQQLEKCIEQNRLLKDEIKKLQEARIAQTSNKKLLSSDQQSLTRKKKSRSLLGYICSSQLVALALFSLLISQLALIYRLSSEEPSFTFFKSQFQHPS
ncbi:uncharacterized protein MONOS_16929 [Monocercomonoides exilis]|uniref:uncharacterized protein n=1 Tax=Monocercomonoides exilis TaxID=2049356 RepID=UPI00355A2383|nr:hypothetical protein MONOS_16929 [Monocercomonoides exilis]